MKKLAAGLVAVLALAMSACVDAPQRPIETVTPVPLPGDTVEPPATASRTPSQEELSAQAEQAYRAFFNEWKRLEFLGGADEPTPTLLENGAGKYLEGVMLFLRDQKSTGYVVQGEMPTATVVPRPGEAELGSDPRLTLAVCEDSRSSWHTDSRGRHEGTLSQGLAYVNIVDGRMKVVWANTEVVQACAL
ncbi:hypothetical protein [Granulicoccus sp. GXG6511]|uniref:hypothetical protein n=1 Tax=Granulicoccus sp. GXG6511 TaxID=3381351 RepID=UPI003D7CB360